tara:strand:+ start:132 stop:386 length:255 start_codon:yes stop_codon:yes gene_type:complete
MKPIKKFQIGKNGLTEQFIEQVKNYFDKSGSELVKVEILKSCCRDKKKAREIGDELAAGLGKNFTYKLVGYVLAVRRWRRAVRG